MCERRRTNDDERRQKSLFMKWIKNTPIQPPTIMSGRQLIIMLKGLRFNCPWSWKWFAKLCRDITHTKLLPNKYKATEWEKSASWFLPYSRLLAIFSCSIFHQKQVSINDDSLFDDSTKKERERRKISFGPKFSFSLSVEIIEWLMCSIYSAEGSCPLWSHRRGLLQFLLGLTGSNEEKVKTSSKNATAVDEVELPSLSIFSFLLSVSLLSDGLWSMQQGRLAESSKSGTIEGEEGMLKITFEFVISANGTIMERKSFLSG